MGATKRPKLDEPPKWNDDEAVAAWVGAVLDERELEAERQFYMRYVNCDVPGIKVSDLFRSMESNAVERAAVGDFRRLDRMLQPGFLGLRNKPFAPETWTLIADRIAGRFKARRGKPKQDVEERMSRFPIHAVAAEVEDIEEILHRHYGEEQGIYKRAMTIAAERGKIPLERLECYWRSRNRIKHRP